MEPRWLRCVAHRRRQLCRCVPARDPRRVSRGSNTRPATCYQEAARAAQVTRPPSSRQHQILDAIVADRHLAGARHGFVGILCAQLASMSAGPQPSRASSNLPRPATCLCDGHAGRVCLTCEDSSHQRRGRLTARACRANDLRQCAALLLRNEWLRRSQAGA